MLHLLPQCPLKNRYTEDWISVWKRELNSLGVSFDIIGTESTINNIGLFQNIPAVVDYELGQINSLENLVRNSKVTHILHLDIDFPGLFSSYAMLLKWRRPDIKIYGFCHAGSWCNGDIFSKSKGKKEMELGTILCFDKIFVATKYHKDKIEKYFERTFDNVIVTGLPFYYYDCANNCSEYVKSFEEKKLYLINGRIEQSNVNLIESFKRRYPELSWVDFSSPYIKNSRTNYFDVLNNTKISISFKEEETFGLSQYEVASLGGLILSPNKYSYPELIPYSELLYNDEEDLFKKFENLLNIKENYFKIPFEDYIYSISNVVDEIYEEDK